MRWAIGAVALQLIGSTAASADVCIEFLTEHPGDPIWEQQCLDWLEQLPPSPSLLSQQASGSASAMGAFGPFADPPVHVSASNLGLAQGNQNEAYLSVDPSDPQRLFYVAMTEPFTNGLFAAHSTDGGASWSPTTIAVGPGGAIPAGFADPWAVWSETGRLYFSYIADPFVDDSAGFGFPSGVLPTIVAESSDGGASFDFVEALQPLGVADRGTMATGTGGAFAEGSLWVIYKDFPAPSVVVRGAALDGAGSPVLDSCGPGTGFFCKEEEVAVPVGNEDVVSPGHVAVGPSGQVLIAYFRSDSGSDPMDVFAELDPDGLGPQPFAPVPSDGSPVLVTGIPAQHEIPPHMARGIGPHASLAWDQTSGRVYLVSTRDEGDFETDIVLIYSDDDGATWSSPPLRVNDDPRPSEDEFGNFIPSEIRSQFFPHVAVDQATGLVVVAWYDPRNDDGGSDGIPNTESQVFVAITQDLKYVPNLQVSAPGFFSRAVSGTSHGDYLGVDVHDGNIHVAWVDNSNSTGDNPDAGTPPGCDPVPCMDAYSARILLPEPGSGASLLVGGAVLAGLAARRRPGAPLSISPSTLASSASSRSRL